MADKPTPEALAKQALEDAAILDLIGDTDLETGSRANLLAAIEVVIREAQDPLTAEVATLKRALDGADIENKEVRKGAERLKGALDQEIQTRMAVEQDKTLLAGDISTFRQERDSLAAEVEALKKDVATLRFHSPLKAKLADCENALSKERKDRDSLRSLLAEMMEVLKKIGDTGEYLLAGVQGNEDGEYELYNGSMSPFETLAGQLNDVADILTRARKALGGAK